MKQQALAAIGLLPAMIGPVSAQQNYGPWHMHDWMGWGGMFFGPVVMILWIAALVAVVVVVLRWLGVGNLGTRPGPRTPREILDERYARGEIDREEYVRRRQDIAGA